LSSSLQTYGLYPAGHPSRQEGIREATAAARGLIDALDEMPVLFVARRSLYLGSTLLARESLTLAGLVDAFSTAGIEALELLPEIGEGDLDTLVLILTGERRPDTEMDGIVANRVRPDVDDSDPRRMSDLLGTYAVGLEHLRQVAAAATADRPVDLEGSMRVVEQLADGITEDPMQALLVTTVKSFDEYTYYHMLNVCTLSLALGYAVGLSREQLLLLGLGALMHDLGKVKIPQDVLRHPGQLNEEQWRLIQRHPVDGAGLIFITSGEVLHPAASIVLEHHAAFNLDGYPHLSGRPHPSVPARLASVADVFDAITTNRSYRQAEDRSQAMEVLQSAAGSGFDPNMVSVFSRLVGRVPVGSLVSLSTGAVGLVVRSSEKEASRPVVQLVLDAERHATEPEEIDLSDRASDGSFLVRIERTEDAGDLGLDMAEVLRGGAAEPEAIEDEGVEPGLVHEPGPGEQPPPGYVDTHNESDEHGPDVSRP
jgi:HD-GYP domain-containing protein (c-di-GMP phosphodiesterase class II)